MTINRDLLLKRVIDAKHNDFVKIITGIRRCGKSFLLFNLFKRHLVKSGVTKDHIIEIDLENASSKAQNSAPTRRPSASILDFSKTPFSYPKPRDTTSKGVANWNRRANTTPQTRDFATPESTFARMSKPTSWRTSFTMN